MAQLSTAGVAPSDTLLFSNIITNPLAKPNLSENGDTVQKQSETIEYRSIQLWG